jgi:drug/metabolite transporter (DMT)-like permease
VPCAFLFEGPLQFEWSVPLVSLQLYSATFGIAIAYWAINRVNRSLPAMTTSLGLLAVPVFGIICSSVILGETLEFSLVASMALIIAGIAIGALPDKRTVRASAS